MMLKYISFDVKYISKERSFRNSVLVMIVMVILSGLFLALALDKLPRLLKLIKLLGITIVLDVDKLLLSKSTLGLEIFRVFMEPSFMSLFIIISVVMIVSNQYSSGMLKNTIRNRRNRFEYVLTKQVTILYLILIFDVAYLLSGLALNGVFNFFAYGDLVLFFRQWGLQILSQYCLSVFVLMVCFVITRINPKKSAKTFGIVLSILLSSGMIHTLIDAITQSLGFSLSGWFDYGAYSMLENVTHWARNTIPSKALLIVCGSIIVYQLIILKVFENQNIG